MEEPSKPARAVVDIGEDCCPIIFRFRDVEFEVDAYEAMDTLAEIDARHAHALHTCRKCGTRFPAAPGTYGSVDQYACPAENCGAAGIADIITNRDYLDEVAAYVEKRYGARGMNRTSASTFYTRVVEVCGLIKKNIG